MNKYNGNPISFRIEGNIVKVLELMKDYREEPFYLEIYNGLGKQVLDKTLIKKDTVLSLDVSEGEYILNYYNIFNNLKIFEQKVQIQDNYKTYLKIKTVVLEQIDNVGSDVNKRYHLEMLRTCNYDNKARKYLENRIENLIRKSFKLDEEIIKSTAKRIFADVYGLGIIQELDDDKSIAEIMVNVIESDTPLTQIYYVKDNEKYDYYKSFRTIDEVMTMFGRVLAGTNKELNSGENSSIEVSRPNDDRVSITIPYFSENYSLNIRRFDNFIPNKENMKKAGTINDESDELLKIITLAELNIGIGGKMGVGKSTLINYLLSFTEYKERKVIISSVKETDIRRTLKGHDIIIYNVDEQRGFTFDKAFVKGLRSTGNRIIVPESRSKEFREVYKACIQTSGNMFTAHATTEEDFLNACVDMYNYDGSYTDIESLKDKLAKGIDIIIIMDEAGKKIRMKSLCEVLVNNGKFIGFNTLYKWVFDKENPSEGHYERGNHMSDKLKNKINEKGVPISMLQNL